MIVLESFFHSGNDSGCFVQNLFHVCDSFYLIHSDAPIYFEKDLRVTIQALGWRSEQRYLPLQDDISSVAYWYSDTLDDVYPPLPDANGLELI